MFGFGRTTVVSCSGRVMRSRAGDDWDEPQGGGGGEGPSSDVLLLEPRLQRLPGVDGPVSLNGRDGEKNVSIESSLFFG